MNIYNVNTEKSKIHWSSMIGDHKIEGEMKAHDGTLISELGRVIEGNITIDLGSMSVTSSSLSKDEREKIEHEFKSLPLFNKEEENLANYKIEEIIPRDNDNRVKGLLTISNQAFGIDVITRSEQSEDELKATGKVAIAKSNPVLLQELDQLYENQLHDGNSLRSFDLECNLIASAS